MGITQPSVARLEAAGDEISIRTLRRALNGMGRALALTVMAREVSYDETLLRANLALTPAERLRTFERFHADARRLGAAGVDYVVVGGGG